MIDRDVVFKHIKDLQRILEELKKLKEITLDDLETNVTKRWEVERGLQLAIQNLLDMGSHILASINRNNIDTYTEVIDRLSEEKILPKDFAHRIRGKAGLRNILVESQ